MPELSLCLGLLLIILYGLFSLSMSSQAPISDTQGSNLVSSVGMNRNHGAASMVNVHLSDVYFFSRMWPMMLLLGYIVDFPLLSDFTLGIGTDTFSYTNNMMSLAYPYNTVDTVSLLF